MLQVPDVDAAVPEVSEDMSVPDVGGSMPEVSADVSVPDVSGEVSAPDVSVSIPDASGDVPVPDVGVSVPDVSGDVSVPSMGLDVPSASVDVPSVDLEGKMPSVEGTVPSVEGDISGDLPSGEVSVTAPDVKVEGGDTSLTAGLAAGGVAALGAVGAAVGLSGDKPSGEVDASVDVPSVDASVEAPSVDVKKPKKGLFGGIFGSSKGKIEVGAVGGAWYQVFSLPCRVSCSYLLFNGVTCFVDLCVPKSNHSDIYFPPEILSSLFQRRSRRLMPACRRCLVTRCCRM